MKIFDVVLIMLNPVFDTLFDGGTRGNFVVDKVVAVLRVEVLAAVRLAVIVLDGLHFNAVLVLGCCFNGSWSLRASGNQNESQTTDKQMLHDFKSEKSKIVTKITIKLYFTSVFFNLF